MRIYIIVNILWIVKKLFRLELPALFPGCLFARILVLWFSFNSKGFVRIIVKQLRP
jgi:hypothetical protein